MSRVMPALSAAERNDMGLRAASGHMYQQDKVWSRYSDDKVDIAGMLARVLRTLGKALPLDRPLTAPNLKGFGLQLLGGRLLPLHGEPAAQLMYEDASGGRYTLFVTRGRGEDTAFRVIEQNGVGAFYWVDHDTAYALIGSAPRDRLLEISREIYAQLDRTKP